MYKVPMDSYQIMTTSIIAREELFKIFCRCNSHLQMKQSDELTAGAPQEPQPQKYSAQMMRPFSIFATRKS